MLIRGAIVSVLIAACGIYVGWASGPEHPAARRSLTEVPLTIEGWRGAEAPPLADDVLSQLGVDDYINRYYAVGGAAQVSLYAGYYASQRTGDTIHSPQNCLPGAGWQPIFSDQAAVAADLSTLPVNRVVIQKGLDRQAVFYWYQGRGRLVADEFASKGWLMLDAARLRRTDGGLVRLMTPVTSTPEDSFRRLTDFSIALVPHLWRHLP